MTAMFVWLSEKKKILLTRPFSREANSSADSTAPPSVNRRIFIFYSGISDLPSKRLASDSAAILTSVRWKDETSFRAMRLESSTMRSVHGKNTCTCFTVSDIRCFLVPRKH